jgi:hypothetical protein
MNILILLILLAIFYLVPELLRRYNDPKKYQYPQIPKKALATQFEAAQWEDNEQVPEYLGYVEKPADAEADISIQMEVVLPASAKNETAWQGKLDHNTMLNGVIFSEILQPPRAYRPIKRPIK